MPKGEKDLRQFIKGKLRTQIEEVWRRAESYHDYQKGDNIQGRVHCETVETNLSRLIPDKKKKKDMKPMELFILSAAACLHDIGKVVPDGAGGWKRDHGKRAMEILLEEYDKLGLDKGQAVAVGFIVSVHNDGRTDDLPDKPYVIGSEEIDIIKLAAVFRLADMLDTNYQRAPEIVSDIKFPNGDIPAKWQGRQAITGWYLDEKDRIILQALPKPEEIDAVLTLKAMMKEELALISPYLKLYGFPAELGDLDLSDVFIKTHLEKKAKLDRPFPGMAFYTQRESDIFKGRDKEIEDLNTQVSCWPISLLVGESGAGKTSLIHAGLFPRLEVMKWKYAWTRPFENPGKYIKIDLWNNFFEGKVDEKKTLLDVMNLAAAKYKPHKLLVVMDQFEDILNCSVPDILEEFCMQMVAVQTGTVIPNLRVLISFREDALVKLNSRLFKKITGSARGFPFVELERLTIAGARAALLAGLEQAGFGIDPRREQGQRPLIDIILDDIRQGEDRLYPPYIQVVAETLCRKVDPGKPIITGDIYFHQLNSASHIIAHYLLERLKEFGSREEKAKKVLICLTSSQGKKTRKSLSELSPGTGIGVEELKDIMKEMIDMRMARAAGEGEFEIIHDYLARVVDEELVQEEDRTVKFLQEQLEFYQQNYTAHKAPIISPPFLANLYRNRKRIKINEEKYPLILCTCLNGEIGLGWYWLKDIERSQMLEMLKRHMSHGKEDIRKEASNGFVRLAAPEDKETILDMLTNDEEGYFKQAAKEAFVKIATPEDREKIMEMVKDKDYNVQKAAKEAFLNIATPEDREKIIEMMKDRGSYVQKEAGEAFFKIATLEDRKKIIDMLKYKHYEAWQAAKKAFLKKATPKAREMIIDMLKDEDYHVRKAAEEAFLKIATPGDREKVIEMMEDEDYHVREAAEEAFLKIATPEDREKVIEMSKDTDYDVRQAAEKAFVKIATPEDREKIIEMVKNEDIVKKKVGVYAFLKISEPADHEKLLDQLAEQCQGWGEKQLEIFKLLSEVDKRLYCPYYEEEKE
jgi:HEAT repeat protein